MDLTKRNLWTYTLGTVGRDTAYQLFTSFLMVYIVFTKGLTPLQFTWVNMLMIAIGIFDGMNDPLMGNILEITRTKWGKFKPWITAGMLGTVAVWIISFCNTLTGNSYVALFGAMYFLYSLVFTMNDIAYWGMLPSLASKKADRDLLTSRAVLMSGVGAAIAQVLVPPLTTGRFAIGGSAVTAYPVLAVIFSVFCIGTQCITLLGVKERPLPPRGAATVNRVGLGTIVKTIRSNDQLLWMTAIFLLSTIAGTVGGAGLGSTYIYFTFGYEGSLYTIFIALGAVTSGVVMLFYKQVSMRFKRDQLIKLAACCIVGGYAAMLLTGLLVPNGAGMFKFALLILCNLFASGGHYLFYLVSMICIANTVEYNEWKTGVRAEGIIFSVRPFLTKLGAVTVQFITWLVYLLVGVLGVTNQIAGLEREAAVGLDAQLKAERVKAVLAGVPQSKGTALIACMALIPIALYVLSYGIYKRKFVLDEARYETILSDLEERKAQV